MHDDEEEQTDCGGSRDQRDDPNQEQVDVQEAMAQAKNLFLPFLRTPDGIPRAARVFVCFVGRQQAARREAVLERLATTIRSGDLCNPKTHTLGLLAYVPHGRRGVRHTQVWRRRVDPLARPRTPTASRGTTKWCGGQEQRYRRKPRSKQLCAASILFSLDRGRNDRRIECYE